MGVGGMLKSSIILIMSEEELSINLLERLKFKAKIYGGTITTAKESSCWEQGWKIFYLISTEMHISTKYFPQGTSTLVTL